MLPFNQNYIHYIAKSCLLLLLLSLSFTSTEAQKRKAIFVIVDGIPADLIEKLETPNLDIIAKEGGYTRAIVGGKRGTYTETPTISAVGYNTVLTGTWVNKHNVWDNDIAAPNYNYPTIFRLLKDQHPEKKITIFSSWLDNRTKLIGEGLPQTRNIKMDFSYDGMELDTVRYPHDNDKKFMHIIDNEVTEHAMAYIHDLAPDLTWVYLQYTDDMGHKYGDSEQFFSSIKDMDRQIGRLWNAVQYRQQQHNEEWQIYITTDHGRDSATGHNHGGQSDREKLGWIVTNAKNLNAQFKSGRASLADIMPSIARFMSITIPQANLREVDGVPLFGPVSITNPYVTRNGNEVRISWQPLRKKGWVNLYIANTNNIRGGGKDEYQLVKKVKLKKRKTMFELPDPSIKNFKIVLETTDNTTNVWSGKF